MADEGFIDRRVEDRRSKTGSFPFILVFIIIAVVMGVGGFFAGKILSGRGGDILILPTSKTQTTSTSDTKKTGQKKIIDPQGTKKTRPDNAEQLLSTEKKGESAALGAEEENEVKSKPGLILLDAFTVNLNDPFGRRYAEVAVNLVINDKIMVNEITGNELMIPRIRDEIFMIISGKSYADLKSTSGKVTLKEEIMIRVNEILKEEFEREPVIEVLFTKFLIQ